MDVDVSICASSKFDLKAGVPRYPGARLPTQMDARVDGRTTDRRASTETKGSFPTGNDGRIRGKISSSSSASAFCLVWGLPPF